MVIGHLALAFTGAAFYVNFAEQPARMTLDDRSLLAEWKLAYSRGAVMQATLALVGFVLGAIAWWQTGTLAFLAGALVILAAWPWTLFAIAPTNKALMATVIAEAGPETRARLVKWDALHRVRTLLGALAVVCFLFALSGV